MNLKGDLIHFAQRVDLAFIVILFLVVGAIIVGFTITEIRKNGRR